MQERLAIAMCKNDGRNKGEVGGLPTDVQLAEGYKVMVALNIETELSLANGVRGTLYQIILCDDEAILEGQCRIFFQRMQQCNLVRSGRTCVPNLAGLLPTVVLFLPTLRYFRNFPGDTRVRLWRLSFAGANDTLCHR